MTLVLIIVGVLIVLALFAAAGGMDRSRRIVSRRAVRERVVERPVTRERIVERPVTRERVVDDGL